MDEGQQSIRQAWLCAPLKFRVEFSFLCEQVLGYSYFGKKEDVFLSVAVFHLILNLNAFMPLCSDGSSVADTDVVEFDKA